MKAPTLRNQLYLEISSKSFDGNETSGVYYGRISVRAGQEWQKLVKPCQALLPFFKVVLSAGYWKTTTPNTDFVYVLKLSYGFWSIYATVLRRCVMSYWLTVVSIVCRPPHPNPPLQFLFNPVPFLCRAWKLENLRLSVVRFPEQDLYFIGGSFLDFSYIFKPMTRENAVVGANHQKPIIDRLLVSCNEHLRQSR